MRRVTILELPARFGDVAGQLERIAMALENEPPGELVLLPELALTGYLSPAGDFDVSRFAETRTGRTAEALSALAVKHGCALVGPLVEREAGRCFNALIGLGPEGECWLHYRKRHPWVPETWATPGDLPMPLVSWRGLTVTAAICFDVHFLPDEAAETLRAADLLLFASAWVEEVDSRPELLANLARTFDVAIVNANWGPGWPRVPGQGRSLAIDRRGVIVAQTRQGQARFDVVLSSLGLRG